MSFLRKPRRAAPLTFVIDVLRGAGGARGVTPSRGRVERKHARPQRSASFITYLDLAAAVALFRVFCNPNNGLLRLGKLFIWVFTPETWAVMTSFYLLF